LRLEVLIGRHERNRSDSGGGDYLVAFHRNNLAQSCDVSGTMNLGAPMSMSTNQSWVRVNQRTAIEELVAAYAVSMEIE
jgi:hypothetical protein